MCELAPPSVQQKWSMYKCRQASEGKRETSKSPTGWTLEELEDCILGGFPGCSWSTGGSPHLSSPTLGTPPHRNPELGAGVSTLLGVGSQSTACKGLLLPFFLPRPHFLADNTNPSPQCPQRRNWGTHGSGGGFCKSTPRLRQLPLLLIFSWKIAFSFLPVAGVFDTIQVSAPLFVCVPLLLVFTASRVTVVRRGRSWHEPEEEVTSKGLGRGRGGLRSLSRVIS